MFNFSKRNRIWYLSKRKRLRQLIKASRMYCKHNRLCLRCGDLDNLFIIFNDNFRLQKNVVDMIL